jgi:hypothetical protein
VLTVSVLVVSVVVVVVLVFKRVNRQVAKG